MKLVPRIITQTCCLSTSYTLVRVSIYRNNAKRKVGWVIIPGYITMRSTLDRSFFNVAKETMFDSGQPGGHLADDWALESRQEHLTVTTYQEGQTEVKRTI